MSVLFLCTLLFICSVSALNSSPFEFKIKKIQRIDDSLAGNSWCGTCVSFMDQAINQLLNIILKVGVGVSCAELCGELSGELEERVCDVLCEIAGIKTFLELIQEAEPDPIFICEELTVCNKTPNAAGNVTSVAVTPHEVPQNSKGTIEVVFAVSSEIGTGELGFQIQRSTEGTPVGEAELLVDTKPGTYKASLQFSTTPTEQQSWAAGTYDVVVALCDGTCGADHSGEKILGEKGTSFIIKGF